MRLEKSEVEGILAAARRFDEKARVYLFGSRADDGKRGGDIDLLVVSETLARDDESALNVAIQLEIGERKIDVLVRSRASITHDAFVAHIFAGAILLHFGPNNTSSTSTSGT